MNTSTAEAQGPAALEIPDGSEMTIGRLAERTGLTPEVLRMWETRHGFPTPVRLPSGHRRYTEKDVNGVLRVLRLREGGLHLEQAIAQVRHDDATLTEGSVYAALRHRFPELPSYTLEKKTLLALSWAIEDESVALARRPLLIGSFQAGRYFEASASRWRELARVARSSYVLADFAATDDSTSPRQVGLPADSPMLREWIVVCDGDGLTAALVAWEVPGQPAGDVRLFEAVWSLDPEVVRAASQTALAISADSGSAAAAAERAELDSRPLPAPTSQRVATALFNRMVAYTDGTVLRARRGR
jgi:DNA-binding transcriptional MerR regulator